MIYRKGLGHNSREGTTRGMYRSNLGILLVLLHPPWGVSLRLGRDSSWIASIQLLLLDTGNYLLANNEKTVEAKLSVFVDASWIASNQFSIS